MKRIFFWGMTSLLSPVVFALQPVTLSGPTPAISPIINAGISQTVVYTITNRVPNHSFPLNIKGISGSLIRTPVFNDCGNKIPPALDVNEPVSCNIGISIAPNASKIGSTVSQQIIIDYQGRKPFTTTITFKVGNARAYIANSNDNTVSMCPVNSVSGALSPCTALSDPSFNFPLGLGMNAAGTFAYVPNFPVYGSNPANIVAICPVSQTLGLFGPCTAVNGNGTFSIGPQRAIVNPQDTFLYVALNTGGDLGAVSICPLLNGGATLGTCHTVTGADSAGNPTFYNPSDIGFSPDGSLVYVSNFGSNMVSICPVLGGGASLGPCILSDGPSSTGVSTFLAPGGLSFNVAHTNFYVGNLDTNTVSVCSLAGPVIGNCTLSNGNGTFNFHGFTVQLSMLATFNVAYAPNSIANTLSVCAINTNGSLGLCTIFADPTLNGPESVYLH